LPWPGGTMQAGWQLHPHGIRLLAPHAAPGAPCAPAEIIGEMACWRMSPSALASLVGVAPPAGFITTYDGCAYRGAPGSASGSPLGMTHTCRLAVTSRVPTTGGRSGARIERFFGFRLDGAASGALPTGLLQHGWPAGAGGALIDVVVGRAPTGIGGCCCRCLGGNGCTPCCGARYQDWPGIGGCEYCAIGTD